MVSVTDLRSGAVFKDEGKIFQVISYEHIKMGRGSATIKVRVRDVKTGTTLDRSFINGARVQDIAIMKKILQFLYKDEDSAHFMDFQTFEQSTIPLKKIQDNGYLKEGENYSVSFLEGEPLIVTFPPKMEFRVVDTGPSLRGNSATNIYKDATLENNLQTKVPLFINTGDVVRIDTRTGEYTEKA